MLSKAREKEYETENQRSLPMTRTLCLMVIFKVWTQRPRNSMKWSKKLRLKALDR